MSKKISLGAAIAYMAIVAAVVFVLTMLYSRMDFNQKIRNLSQREAFYNSLSELDQYARESYYHAIDEAQLSSSLLAGYVAGLGDPYARFLTAREYEAYLRTDGRYSGIGVRTEKDPDGYIRITEVYPESPAEVSGLRPGDLITTIDGVAVNAADAVFEEMQLRLQGDAGTKVTLVLRREADDLAPVEVTRRFIEAPTVRTKMQEGVAYLRISAIVSHTPGQLDRALRQVMGEGAIGLIFDLRGTESDNMKAVAEMLDILLPKMTTIYSASDTGQPVALYQSDESQVNLPMAVLTDKTTKGAPEMFAMAVRDTGKGRTVGETTYGKGSLQEAKKLRDGSAVILTTAVFSGPSGSTYDLTGVPADFEVRLGVEDEYKANVLGMYEADAQYRKAQEVVVTAARAAEGGSSSSVSP